LTAGRADWFDLAGELPEEAGDLLRATASFCGGWGPMPGGDSGARCGGVAAALHLLGGRITGGKAIDLVCGFPVPAVRRPQVVSVFELVQRQDELAAALAVAEWRHRDRRKIRIVAPEQASWEAWAERDGADLGLEYPLPWDSNGELMGLVLRYGDFVGRRE
jgi:hypothetical protein